MGMAPLGDAYVAVFRQAVYTKSHPVYWAMRMLNGAVDGRAPLSA
ncbi:MAG: hypothetical protein ETSY1_26165 [Candidatus Entotheonella factor]|uniref:Uncharacterized protein n=1 Tax=Entotheonella factor TaxID=1429438 RepID=W4LFP3_ENTF1|nr:MAG: hypothetical protein ETSY1_26165 [Candidatus Entotheonella factor]